MSATLPTYLTDILHECCREFLKSRPTATMENSAGTKFASSDGAHGGPLRSDLRRCDQGMAVLVVATTVGRAQEIGCGYRPDRLRVDLLHGRFHSDDREGRRVGSIWIDKQQTGIGDILVATQVVEVSLNVDFDVLYPIRLPRKRSYSDSVVSTARVAYPRTVNVCRRPTRRLSRLSSWSVSKAVDALTPGAGSASERAAADARQYL